MANSEERERMAAALAMASLADSVPITVPANAASVPDNPSPVQEQDTSRQEMQAGNRRKKPKLPKLSLPTGTVYCVYSNCRCLQVRCVYCVCPNCHYQRVLCVYSNSHYLQVLCVYPNCHCLQVLCVFT